VASGGLAVSDKRKQFKTIFDKLKKLLPHLGNENQHEANVAREKIIRLLRSVGLDWNDIAVFLGEQQDPVFDLLGKLLEKPEDAMVRLALHKASFFHSKERAPFADIDDDGHRVTLPMSGDDFGDWLLHEYFLERKLAPSATAMKAAIRTLTALAKFEAPCEPVYQRLADIDGTVFLDLANAQCQVVEIDQAGWRVVDRSRARFRRTPGMAALPVPVRGGKIADLRRFINVSDDSFVLYVAAILQAFRAGQPLPVLYLPGEEGSGKTAATRIARELTDPSDAPVRTLPETVRDLFVAAHNAHTIAFDNVSEIKPAISDALCQISSGSGFSRRKNYTDSEEFRVSGSRFVIMNGLANTITRADLADRALILPTSPIRPDERRSDVAFWKQFNAARPPILGALLDALVHGLREMPFIELPHKPRMADFALWGCAVEGAFAKPGDFMRAFTAQAADAVEVVIEEDCVGTAVGALMLGRESWTSTAAELLIELTDRDRTEAGVAKMKDWPKDATRLSRRLRQLTATLRKAGVEVLFGKASDRRTRMVELRSIKPADPQKSQSYRRPSPTADAVDAADATDAEASTEVAVAFPKENKG
jgi:hypothetical protein